MRISEFLNNIEHSCSEISYFCAKHMLNKFYDISEDDISEDELKDFFANYSIYLKYLNDIAGKIYRQYESSIDEVFYEICTFLNIEADNKYLFEYRVKRLEINEPSRVMRIPDNDIKIQTAKNLQEELSIVLKSKYYKKNEKELSKRIESIKNNLKLLDKALFIHQ